VWDGAFFRLDDHLERFQRGCKTLRLSCPFKPQEIKQILCEIVSRSGLRRAYVETIVTRGVPGPGERDPRLWKPSFYAYAIPYVWIVAPEVQEIGTDVVVARTTQRISPSAVDPTVKNFHWGDLTRGLFEAYDRGAWLPILTNGMGLVAEGPGFNVFALVQGRLASPSHGALQGITRKTVIDIAGEAGLPLRIGDLPVEDLYRAEEIFLSSTAGGIMPVRQLDGQPVGAACPGPVTTMIRDRYWALHADPRFTLPVDYQR
jgi:branched-chain amino acid aminotransferase